MVASRNDTPTACSGPGLAFFLPSIARGRGRAGGPARPRTGRTGSSLRALPARRADGAAGGAGRPGQHAPAAGPAAGRPDRLHRQYALRARRRPPALRGHADRGASGARPHGAHPRLVGRRAGPHAEAQELRRPAPASHGAAGRRDLRRVRLQRIVWRAGEAARVSGPAGFLPQRSEDARLQRALRAAPRARVADRERECQRRAGRRPEQRPARGVHARDGGGGGGAEGRFRGRLHPDAGGPGRSCAGSHAQRRAPRGGGLCNPGPSALRSGLRGAGATGFARARGRHCGQEPAVLPPLPTAQHLLLHRRPQRHLRLPRFPARDARIRRHDREPRTAHRGDRPRPQLRRRARRRLERAADAAGIGIERCERMAAARGRARRLQGRSAFRGQPVRLRGAVSRRGQAGADALGCPRPAVGELLDDVSARVPGARTTSR